VPGKFFFYHFLRVTLLVLLLTSGAVLLYLLYWVGTEDDHRIKEAAERPKNAPVPEQQAAQAPSLPTTPKLSKQQSAETTGAASAPHKSKELNKPSMDTSTIMPLAEEDEAVLALMEEVEPPVPLGPEFEELAPPDDDTQQIIELHQALYESSGTMMAQGKSPKPIGPMHIETYRVEEIVLPQATEVDIAGRESLTQTAWRIAVTGGPFPVGALPVVVWSDGRKIGFGQPSPDLSTLFAVTFDPSLVHEGATIAVSYGESGVKTVFSEKLKLEVPP
jgi:hypothetical protein